MESKINVKKIVFILVFTSLISFACLGFFSDYEKGPVVDTDYFSFAEPRLKDDPRYYDLDEYDDYAAVYDEDQEILIEIYIEYGDTSSLDRQLDHMLDDMDIRDESDPDTLNVGGFPAISTTYAYDDRDWDISVAGQIVIVDLQEEAEEDVYLFVFARSLIDNDNEIEEAQVRFDEEVEPMLEIILDTLEFFDLNRF